ncbi:MAG: UDP-N-acetylmuramate--L-alanine ligase [Deltaproteobacteria bacterium RIFCSPLOWO2_02_FULL_50_16]|nr:MAG: UDP-N-acetylmuramate--L-alanine ligase [Deltaproteobacteria bacterium RIFCSPLOWO2_02_FULL_50_16]OGQ66790.1 MAG: UDP-N-acetylmuramate--L-alanine ligase [Deltaproteobacteria bacterium RIFCSPLOWO2_12_FULL_50_11]
MFSHIQKIHFVGIGGIGMSGIAEVLLTLGYKVSGSDAQKTTITRRLRRRGAKVYYGHQRENLKNPHVVVYSSAIAPSNPEIVEARRLDIPLVARAEMLAELMRLKYGIAIAGTHGKTTVTSLIANILTQGGLDPTFVVGGKVKSLRTNARLGKGDFLVAEADESDRSFMHLSPTIAVVTNIDPEHMEHYRDYDELKNIFKEFCLKIPFYGVAVLCVDHPAVAAIAASFPKRFLTYGIHTKADFMAHKIKLYPFKSSFELKINGKSAGQWRINLMGSHHIQNALAAIAVGNELGIPLSSIKKGLSQFKGIGRRLEPLYKNEHQKIYVIDDYGHHPVEIRETLNAIRQTWPQARLIVIFQPHRYTRTKALFSDFTKIFDGTNELFITQIYAAGEPPIHGVSAKKLADNIHSNSFNVHYRENLNDVVHDVRGLVKKNTIVVTFGAGDVNKVGKQLSKMMKEMPLQ